MHQDGVLKANIATRTLRLQIEYGNDQIICLTICDQT